MRLIYAVVVQSAAMVSSSPYSAEMVSGAESNHQHEDFQSSAIPPLFENVLSWPNAVISEHEIKRLPNVRFFAKNIFAPRNQFPIGALRIPKINQIVRPE